MNTPSTFFDGIDTTINTGSSTGATIHSIGGYVVHEWTGSATVPTHTGTFTPATTAKYEFFMVGYGGDGDGGAGGGGGGGEVVLGSITLQSGSTYSVQVGNNNQSDPSRFASVYAYGGGRGGRGGTSSPQDGFDGATGGAGTGGSGGGGGDAAAVTTTAGGDSSATNGILNYIFRYGNDGGESDYYPNNGDGAGGGGGAVSAGENGDQTAMPLAYRLGGDGGDGYPNDWLGSTTYYGGGGGGSAGGNGAIAGAGGLGGGNGAVGSANAQSATAFTGGGGGGSDTGLAGGGANGIVLIRYRTSV